MDKPPTSDYYDAEAFIRLVNSFNLRKNDNLSVFHVNIRSMKNKIFELDNVFQSLRYSFDVLAFTETWFCNKDDVVALHGYSSEGVYRNDRRGGGTSIYIKKG